MVRRSCRLLGLPFAPEPFVLMPAGRRFAAIVSLSGASETVTG